MSNSTVPAGDEIRQGTLTTRFSLALFKLGVVVLLWSVVFHLRAVGLSARSRLDPQPEDIIGVWLSIDARGTVEFTNDGRVVLAGRFVQIQEKLVPLRLLGTYRFPRRGELEVGQFTVEPLDFTIQGQRRFFVRFVGRKCFLDAVVADERQADDPFNNLFPLVSERSEVLERYR
jgi:hypothetical protein